MSKKYIFLRPNIIFGIILIIISLFIYYETKQIPLSPYEPLGASFFPGYLSLFIVFCSIVIIIQDLYKYRHVTSVQGDNKKKELNGKEGNIDNKSYIRHPFLGFITLVSIFLYIFIMPYIGFRLATVIFIFTSGHLIFRYEKKTNKVINYIVLIILSLVMSLGLYFIFTKFMIINLP